MTKVTDHTIAELEEIVRDADDEVEQALRARGEDSRVYREAIHTRRFYQRHLERAQEREAERQLQDKRPPKEVARAIADRMDR